MFRDRDGESLIRTIDRERCKPITHTILKRAHIQASAYITRHKRALMGTTLPCTMGPCAQHVTLQHCAQLYPRHRTQFVYVIMLWQLLLSTTLY
jgi:hypothetical protein